MASVEDILKESQVRDTEHLEVFFERDAFAEAKQGLEAWKADMPDESQGFDAYEGNEAIKVWFYLAFQVLAAIRARFTHVLF